MLPEIIKLATNPLIATIITLNAVRAIVKR